MANMENMENVEKKFKKLVVHLLDDDDGINEDAYLALLEVGEALGLDDICRSVRQKAKTANGRFYCLFNDYI